ncbi:MAG: hypothetical protein E7162_05450 [Firmicutes bacterium]|nr:hypothetical protein [Bacillota bacterium]
MKKIKEAIKESNKASVIVYFILRFLVILCLIREICYGNFENALICVLALILFLVPAFLEKTLKIEFPTTLEILIFVFIFSAEILGEINNFYGKYELFDDILHAINGFACASIGFSSVYILNEKTKSLKLSPFFIALVSFCFSMTIGVLWEFFEYNADKYLGLDMQKDTYVENINTVMLDPEESNKVIKIEDIEYTILYDKDGKELTKIDNYLDLGIHDTMEDLKVNFIGAFVFSIYGYLYTINNKKYKLAGKFITKKV